MADKSLNWNFRLLQGLLILIECAAISYISPILVSLGFGLATIGKIAAVAALAAAAARPIWGYINDRYACTRQILLCGVAAGVFFYNLLTHSLGHVLITYISVAGLQVTICCMMNLADAWAMCLIRNGYPLDYGSTRVGGSISYAFGGVLYGMISARFGYGPSNIILWIFWGVLLLITIRIPNPTRIESSQKISFAEGVRALSRNNVYLIMLCALFVSTTMTTAMENFYSVQILNLGGTEREVGIALFIQAISEVPVMLNYRRIRKVTKLSSASLMAVSFLFYGVKAFLIGSCTTVLGLVLCAMVQCMCYAIFVTASVDFILDAVEENYLATAHMVFLAIGHGVASVISNLFWGQIAERTGIERMFHISSLLAIVAVALACISSKLLRDRMRKDGKV